MLLRPQGQSTLCNQTIQKNPAYGRNWNFWPDSSTDTETATNGEKGQYYFLSFFLLLFFSRSNNLLGGVKRKTIRKKEEKMKLGIFFWLVESINFFLGGCHFLGSKQTSGHVYTALSLLLQHFGFPPSECCHLNYFASYTQETCKYCHP